MSNTTQMTGATFTVSGGKFVQTGGFIRDRRCQAWAFTVEGVIVSVWEGKGAAVAALLRAADLCLDGQIVRITRKQAQAFYAAKEETCPAFAL